MAPTNKGRFGLRRSGMQTVAWLCNEGSTGGASVGGGGDALEAVCTTRRNTGPRHELVYSSRGSRRCHQTGVFCLGWSPSTVLSDGLLPQGMKQAVAA
jgi:hypothetical protein